MNIVPNVDRGSNRYEDAGRFVNLQRRTSSGSWVNAKRVKLNARGEARFLGRFSRGRTQARMWVNSAPGYIPGFSVTKTVRR